MTDKQVEQIQHALTEALAMPSMKVAMEVLLLDGVANLPLETYRPIGDLERWALRMGYHEIPWVSTVHLPPRDSHRSCISPGAERVTDLHAGEPGTFEVIEDRTDNCACTGSDPNGTSGLLDDSIPCADDGSQKMKIPAVL